MQERLLLLGIDQTEEKHGSGRAKPTPTGSQPERVPTQVVPGSQDKLTACLRYGLFQEGGDNMSIRERIYWGVIASIIVCGSIGAGFPAKNEDIHKIGNVGTGSIYTFKDNSHRCYVAVTGKGVDLECW